MTVNQSRLLAYMQFLSQRYFNAPWADGIEYALWHWLYTPESCPLSDAERHTLFNRHVSAKGWMRSKGTVTIFIETKPWIRHYVSEFQEEARKFACE